MSGYDLSRDKLQFQSRQCCQASILASLNSGEDVGDVQSATVLDEAWLAVWSSGCPASASGSRGSTRTLGSGALLLKLVRPHIHPAVLLEKLKKHSSHSDHPRGLKRSAVHKATPDLKYSCV